jgi:hypothetical protein
VIARVAVAVVAVAVIAWLGVMERDTRLLARADAAAHARDYAAAERDLRDADTLTADTTADVRLAFLLGVARKRGDEARAVLEDVVRREPDNLTAWGLLLSFSRESDPAAAARARAALRRLDPQRAR